MHAPLTNPMRDSAVVPERARKNMVEVRKGDIITIPIQAADQRTEVWAVFRLQVVCLCNYSELTVCFSPQSVLVPGTGVHYRYVHTEPQRWRTRTRPPGMYAHILTFLHGNPSNGNRACRVEARGG
ncbi:hypothetical protein GLOTRDRAFT_130065 [Gloeophyllum trabeum ATCC 11539]|uniref:Uncharacterized protein n=1 Tax=Gloeophyllum trabeum (strain ATCC 11539 / FP-39264 / Madison 617) TaxID=670483 RepID=S7RPE6_GLOTA|nr:uncharacterized protein GLOTRDRAFT_130065 [Gloeophyllum trabeum ATCC 11539]EPQ54714.1 hypothetical protein GLOTRDRAFT_130065 [Gloeophyllum trabeum ATCC 11539]